MIQLLLSIGAIYGFIFLGFFAKARFKMRLDEQTLTLVSVYLLQPVMAFWGLMLRPIDLELLSAPAIYWGLTFGVLLLTLVMGRLFFADAKERAIATVSPLISNTGNLGIPLGIMLLGVESAAFTNLINLGNVFFVYTFGVYFYSRATFSIRESLTNILKMPVLWSALVAIGLNVSGAGLPPEIEQGLMMGAYASMVIQLILFGVYIYGTKGYRISRKLSIHVTGIKFGLLPLLGAVLLWWLAPASLVSASVFLELLMPLAITNATLAALYRCRLEEVTAQVLLTSLLFIVVAVVAIGLLGERLGFFHLA